MIPSCGREEVKRAVFSSEPEKDMTMYGDLELLSRIGADKLSNQFACAGMRLTKMSS